GAGDDHAADAEVRVDAVDGGDQRLDDLAGERIAGLGLVEGEGDDAPLLFVDHGFGHGLTPVVGYGVAALAAALDSDEGAGTRKAAALVAMRIVPPRAGGHGPEAKSSRRIQEWARVA